MTIIPYMNRRSLQSDPNLHFQSLGDAAMWAYDEMEIKPDDLDTIVFRFRIIDSEEDFTISLSRKDGFTVAAMGWMDLPGFNLRLGNE